MKHKLFGRSDIYLAAFNRWSLFYFLPLTSDISLNLEGLNTSLLLVQTASMCVCVCVCACVCVRVLYCKCSINIILLCFWQRRRREEATRNAFKRFFQIYFFIYIFFENVSNRKTFVILEKKQTNNQLGREKKSMKIYAILRFSFILIRLKSSCFGKCILD